MKYDLKDYPEIKLVDELNLGPGWVLIDVIENEEVVTSSVCFPMVMRGSNGCSDFINRESYSVPTVVKKPKFLMGKFKHQVIEDLKNQIEADIKLRAQHILALGDCKKELETSQKTLANAKAEFSVQTQELDRKRKYGEDQAALRYKMEQDLAKVRRAIGEMEFNKIVGEQK